jgi:hypothetical protein
MGAFEGTVRWRDLQFRSVHAPAADVIETPARVLIIKRIVFIDQDHG